MACFTMTVINSGVMLVRSDDAAGTDGVVSIAGCGPVRPRGLGSGRPPNSGRSGGCSFVALSACWYSLERV